MQNTNRFCLCKVYVCNNSDGEQILKAIYYRMWYGNKSWVVDC